MTNQTTQSDLELRFCGSCRKELIEKHDILDESEIKNSINNLIAEIDILQKKNTEIENAIEINQEFEEQKMTFIKKLFRWMGFNMCPKDLQNERFRLNQEKNAIKFNLEQTQKKLYFYQSVLRRNIIPAQKRYHHKLLLKQQKKQALLQRSSETFNKVISSIEQNRDQYFIRNKDYKRGNPLENYIKNNWREKILKLHSNKCASCKSMEDITLDHFWLPKNEGGNFAMFHVDSHALISNVIPLCRSCNSAKGDMPFQNFFTLEQLKLINRIQQDLSKQLMDDPQLCIIASKWYRKNIISN
jgi:5-methylcytosine-specific restriction endonuclease McrA